MVEKSRYRSIACFLVIFWMVLSGCRSDDDEKILPGKSTVSQFSSEKIIVALGDSLTAGLGVDVERAYPAVLGEKLNQSGFDYRVVNAGVSGETSSGTRSRLDWILSQKPQIVILEIGANDGLRGIDTGLVRENIGHILTELDTRGIVTIFAGMQMVWNLGAEYTHEFNRIFPELAEKHDVLFVPFFLEGVAMVPHLNGGDGIHPNAQGYRVIVDNMYPYVLKAIAQVEQGDSK